MIPVWGTIVDEPEFRDFPKLLRRKQRFAFDDIRDQ